MAQVAKGVLVLMNGTDLSCYLKSVDMPAEVDMLDSTALCTTGSRNYQPGLNSRTLSAEGFWDYTPADDALSVDKVFSDAMDPNADNLITVGDDGFELGDVAKMFNAKQTAYSVQETVGELVMAMLEATATLAGALHAFARGIFLMSQTVTGAVNGSSVDNAASSVGYFAHVHNTDADGTASVKVQHSVDNSVWVDLIDFGAVAANAAEQAVSEVTTVNRYRRAIVTAIGGTTNKVSVGFASPYPII